MSLSKSRLGSLVSHSLPSPCTSTATFEDDFPVDPLPKRGGRKESEQRRRVMMNQYFDELITLLSMVSERNIPKKMDKATTLMEAMTCVRVYYDLTNTSATADNLMQQKLSKSTKMLKPKMSTQPQDATSIKSGFKPSFLMAGETLQLILDAYNSFLFVISESGRILYSTELVTSLLGHVQTRLVGQNIFDYVHKDDQDTVKQLFKPADPSIAIQLPNAPIKAFPLTSSQLQMKLYSGETSCLPQYLPFLCLSYLRQWDDSADISSSDPPSPASLDSDVQSRSDHRACVLLLGKLPTSLTLIDLAVGTNDVGFEFEMRVSREGRIIDVDKHAILVFGFSAAELLGSSLFDLVDPYHINHVGESMSTFLQSGMGVTSPYRIRTKGGRYLWLISKGYLSYNPWNHRPDHMLLTNRVLGCDQVLPEHRFFHSKKLFPNLEESECYAPPPLHQSTRFHETGHGLTPPISTPSTTSSSQPPTQPQSFQLQPPHTMPMDTSTTDVTMATTSSGIGQVEKPHFADQHSTSSSEVTSMLQTNQQHTMPQTQQFTMSQMQQHHTALQQQQHMMQTQLPTTSTLQMDPSTTFTDPYSLPPNVQLPLPTASMAAPTYPSQQGYSSQFFQQQQQQQQQQTHSSQYGNRGQQHLGKGQSPHSYQ